MTRTSPRKHVDPAEASGFLQVAEELFRTGERALEDRRWNAAVLNYVHAVIAYADALTVRRAGLKAQVHDQAFLLFREASEGLTGNREAAQRLERVIGKKERAAYTGEVLNEKTAREVQVQAERFRSWARVALGE